MSVVIRDDVVVNGDYVFDNPSKDLIVDANITASGNISIRAKNIAILRKIEGLNLFFKAEEDFISVGSIAEKETAVYEVRGDLSFSPHSASIAKMRSLGLRVLVDSVGCRTVAID